MTPEQARAKIKKIDRLIDKLQDKRLEYDKIIIEYEVKRLTNPLFEALKDITRAQVDGREL